jgi:hypothetical protein
MRARMIDSKMLATAVGRYMEAVSEELVSRGVAVGVVRSCGPYEGEGHSFDDVEGEVSVAASGNGRSEHVLHWSGVSGWGIASDEKMPFSRYARWMHVGLLPHPAEVASFCTAFVEAPFETGHQDAPTYRQPGKDFSDLVRRLAAY